MSVLRRLRPPAVPFIDRLREWYIQHAENCLTSGYIPRPYRPLQWIGRYVIARLWVFIQVGRIEIKGKEFLDIDGPVIFAPNHQSMFDAIIVFAVMKRWPRYMTAIEQMRGVWGLRAMIMGAGGCFAVDRSQGKTVIAPAIDVIASGEAMVVFPEGGIWDRGPLLAYRSGIGKISKGACEVNPRITVRIVPTRICFGKTDPDTALEDNYFKTGFRWRGGATITFFPPIEVTIYSPESPKEIAALVRAAAFADPCPAYAAS